MGYRDKARAAVAQKAAVNVEPTFVKIVTEGTVICGRYLSRVIVKGKEKMGDVYYYTFDTDDGAIKTRFGQAFDNTTGVMMKEGHIYSVTYQGKKPIGHNQEVRMHETLEIPDDIGDAPADGEEEVPI